MKNLRKLFVMILTSIFFIVLNGLNLNVEAATINEQISEGQNNIVLEGDITEDFEIPEEATVTIDLNGHTLTTASQTGTRGIINEGNLTIKATNGGTITNGTSYNGSYGIIDNYGILTIDGGIFKDYGQGDGSSVKNRGGTITINKGEFISNGVKKGNACVYSDGNLTVANGVSFKSYSEGAYPLIVNSGGGIIGNVIVEGVKGGVAVNSGEVTINGGTYTGNNYYGIWITNNGNTMVTINNGNFTGKYGLYTAVDDGRQDVGNTKIIINGGVFTGTQKAAVSMNSSGSIRDWGMTIKGGTFSTDVRDYVPEGYTVYNIDEKYIVDLDGDVTTNTEKITMKLGSTQDLDINVSEYLRKYITISSSNESIVQVIGNEIKALSIGNANIIVDTNSGKGFEIPVVIYNVEPENLDDNLEISVNQEIEDVITNLIEGNQNDKIDEDTKNKLITAINESKTIKTDVVTESVNEDNIKEDVNKLKEKIKDNTKIAGYYDISIILKADGEEIGRVKYLNNEIPITIRIPNNIGNLQNGFDRVYKIIRVHDNNLEVLETLNNGDGTLTFRTNKFSTYLLAYTDVKKEEVKNLQNDNSILEENTIKEEKEGEIADNTNNVSKTNQNPKTGDTIMMAVILLIVSIIGIISITAITIKKKRDK